MKEVVGREIISGRQVEAGDVILYKGEWKYVVSVYIHRLSPYNKIHVVDEGENADSIPMYTRLGLNEMFYRREVVCTKHLHFSNAVEEMAELKQLIEEYDSAMDLPEKVKLANTNFEIDAVIVQRECHERMNASLHKLKNTLALVKKP